MAHKVTKLKSNGGAMYAINRNQLKTCLSVGIIYLAACVNLGLFVEFNTSSLKLLGPMKKGAFLLIVPNFTQWMQNKRFLSESWLSQSLVFLP